MVTWNDRTGAADALGEALSTTAATRALLSYDPHFTNTAIRDTQCSSYWSAVFTFETSEPEKARLLPKDFAPPIDLRGPESIQTARDEEWWIPTPAVDSGAGESLGSEGYDCFSVGAAMKRTDQQYIVTLAKERVQGK